METGIHDGPRVQITRGLSGGETVIANGSYGLPDKTKVKIVEPEAPPAPPKPPAGKDKD